MSSIKQQAHPHIVTIKDLVTWTITLGILAGGVWGGMKVNEAVMNTKFNDFKENTKVQSEYFDKRLDKQDDKLDLIITSLHQIELNLKDKQDR